MRLSSALLSFTGCLVVPVVLMAGQLPGVPRDKQPPSQTQSRMREKRLNLTVTGCVRGSRLQLSRSSANDGTAAMLNTDELLLDGPKELMQQLRKQHDGHEDELTGVAVLKASPDGSSTTDVESKPLGKNGRLTVGVHESDGLAGDVKQPVRFRVASVRHISDSCSQLP
jgi:hypothetical protein